MSASSVTLFNQSPSTQILTTLTQNPWFDRLFMTIMITTGVGLVMLIGIPLVTLMAAWITPGESEYWTYFPSQELPRLIHHTLILTGSVWITTMIMGVTLAWITTFIDFHGRSFAVVLAFIPFCIPPYVMGFVWLDLWAKLAHFGFISSQTYQLLSGMPGLVWSMSLSLSPYVFMSVRLVMQRLDDQLLEAAKSLNQNPLYTMRKVVIPLVIPALLASTFLVASEVISDIGTVNVYAYDTLSTAILKVWFGFFSPHDALKVAAITMILSTGLFVITATLIKNPRRWHTDLSSQPPPFLFTSSAKFSSGSSEQLNPTVKYLVSFGVIGFLALGSLVPITSLITMAAQTSLRIHQLTSVLSQTVILAGGVAVVLAMLSVTNLFISRFLKHRQHSLSSDPQLVQLATGLIQTPVLGYAIPGAVLAISLYVPLMALPLFTGITSSIVILLIALAMHFYGVSHQTLAPPFRSLSPTMDESAANLKSTASTILTRIHLPLLKGPILMAICLVFMDITKELPLTLMLRPLDWNTLSVKIYESSTEGLWSQAAWPALTLVLICLGCTLICTLIGQISNQPLYPFSQQKPS